MLFRSDLSSSSRHTAGPDPYDYSAMRRTICSRHTIYLPKSWSSHAHMSTVQDGVYAAINTLCLRAIRCVDSTQRLCAPSVPRLNGTPGDPPRRTCRYLHPCIRGPASPAFEMTSVHTRVKRVYFGPVGRNALNTSMEPFYPKKASPWL